MRFTDNQRAVFAACELDGRQSVAQLAKRTGLRPHAVRAARDRLEAQGLYRTYVSVNVNAVGLADYGIFIRRGMTAAQRGKFIDYTAKCGQVPWVVEFGGAFQFCFAYLGRNVAEVDQFLVELSEKFPGVFKDRYIAPRIQWELYPHKFLAPGKGLSEKLSWGLVQEPAKLDPLDQRVLAEVCRYPDRPISALARALDMPASSFHYRLSRLVTEGVIIGFPAYINYRALGIRKYMLLVYEQETNRSFRKKFETFCHRHPHVTTCLRSLAEWTYEVDVEIEEGDDLSAVQAEILETFGENISNIESLEYLKTHKMCPYSPLSPAFSDKAA